MLNFDSLSSTLNPASPVHYLSAVYTSTQSGHSHALAYFTVLSPPQEIARTAGIETQVPAAPSSFSAVR